MLNISWQKQVNAGETHETHVATLDSLKTPQSPSDEAD